MNFAFFWRPTLVFLFAAMVVSPASGALQQDQQPGQQQGQQPTNVFGFTILPKQNAPGSFDAGFSMYPTIWSLVETIRVRVFRRGSLGPG